MTVSNMFRSYFQRQTLNLVFRGNAYYALPRCTLTLNQHDQFKIKRLDQGQYCRCIDKPCISNASAQARSTSSNTNFINFAKAFMGIGWSGLQAFIHHFNNTFRNLAIALLIARFTLLYGGFKVKSYPLNG
jgi:hypothetical protein